jgi:kinetochor protein Mis14/NSL1
VEYEPFDGKLAARVASLYAQLESLTTTVAQLRRDAPRRAAREYAKELGRIIEEEDKEFDDEEEDDADVEMNDADADRNQDQLQAQPEEDAANTNEGEKRRRGKVSGKKEWNLNLPLGTEQEAERWRNGEMAEVYEDALRTLLRLQGEPVPGNNDAAMSKSDGVDGNALASTVGKAERAGRAVEFVEKI